MLVSKVAIPGVGWFALCLDTEGNKFGLMEDDPKAKQSSAPGDWAEMIPLLFDSLGAILDSLTTLGFVA